MEGKISLYELQQLIRDSLYLSLPDFYWVTAEIAEIRENYSGHCYLELIEKQEDDKNVRARVKAVIWGNRNRFLSAFFRDATGDYLREGMKILVKSKIEYHELYGLSLVISDIDPAYTIGEMALKRQMIIKRLGEEGVISMNREIQFPLLPQRIAIVSSENAAGYRDFMSHLKGNSYGYVFYTALFEAVMQGAETEKSVIAALDRIADNAEHFDMVAIIRGGGAVSDLSWFDNYNIAFHVTQFPLPVLTGIGHEKDLSVTDIVAFQALKTPTAVADFIVEKAAAAEETLNELIIRINDLTSSEIERKRIVMESLKMRITGSSAALVSGSGMTLDRHRSDIKKSVSHFLEKTTRRLETFLNMLVALDPKNVLRRGYSITTVRGKVLRNSSEVNTNDRIKTKLYSGEIESNVINILIPPAPFSPEGKKGV
ncbi:MAG: exodeoxyribonuclease VII large subunit [Bacteroidales bacterium]|jgi:exodeoxyribonuclease VII large subunit|nr:exodeoxyribonuclease VII large subunit [Bacteroidales bacterium]